MDKRQTPGELSGTERSRLVSSPHFGLLVLPALPRWACSGRSSLCCGAARSFCPCWGRNPPPLHHYPAHHPSLSSQLRSSASSDEPSACSASLSLFSSFPVHIWGNPMGFSGGTPSACSWPPIPAVPRLHVGEGRFRHLINLDLICK